MQEQKINNQTPRHFDKAGQEKYVHNIQPIQYYAGIGIQGIPLSNLLSRSVLRRPWSFEFSNVGLVGASFQARKKSFVNQNNR